MLALKIFHNEEKGFILLGMLFIMVLVAVTALGMNRSAVMQARMAANQTHAVQTNFGRLAAIEHAGWKLKQNPGWRTDPAGEDYVYNGITYKRKVLDSSIEGYTDAITITASAPGGLETASASTSFRVTASQANSYFIADTNNCRIRKVDGSGEITTVAGNGTEGYSGDGGPATEAQLGTPKGVAIDASGNIYIADTNNDCIRKVDASGNITTVAGTGSIGDSGDGGPATEAQINNPNDVYVDSSGNIYIADTDNHRIRKVDAASPYNINTIAGTGSRGNSGDGGPATEAKIGFPRGVYVDSSGNIYIADTYNHIIRKVDGSGVINTIAGTGSKGDSGDGGPATEAEFYSPYGVFLDASGNIFIADQRNNRIRKVDASTGIITTVAGNGTGGYSGDGGPATEANIEWPKGLCVDASGNILIADTDNHCIRKVDASTGIITTIAGTPDSWGYSGDGGPAAEAQLGGVEGVAAYVPPSTKKYYLIADIHNEVIRKVDYTGTITTTAGTPGSSGYSGDDGPAISAQLNWPETVSIDSSENIYISDSGNYCIRKVDGTTGTITTIAGNGTYGYSGDDGPATSAQLKDQCRVAVDGSGNIYIADIWNHIIRKVDGAGDITTVAGTPESSGYSGDNGPATSAHLYYPSSVAVDGSGNIYIADTYNHIIRKVDGAGDINTVAGTPESSGYSGDNGPATSAHLYYPSSVAVDGSGNIYIADTDNYRIRKVDGAGDITTVAGTGISDYTGDGGPATSADLKYPYAVHVDASGNIFITENADHTIRKVDTGGIITTVAGTPGSPGYSGDGMHATSAELDNPGGVYMFGAASPPPPSSSSLEKVTEMY